jgi:phosphoserine phosphatase RsbU/P
VAEVVDQVGEAAPASIGCMEVWGGNGSAKNFFQMPGLDVWILSHRRETTASDCGDVHFLSSCASGRITRMLLGEVCGQLSVSYALATQLRRLMVREINVVSQRGFLRDMDAQLRDFADRGGFATGVISTYFAPRGTLTLCNVGHPAPLVYRASLGEWSLLKRDSPSELQSAATPLGVVDQGEYQQFETRLTEGDMVLSYSNSLTECRDVDGRTLGVEGISRQILQIDPSHPANIAAALAHRIRQWDPTTFAGHDVTVILCRATRRGVGWKNNLLAPFRFFGSVTDKTRLE